MPVRTIKPGYSNVTARMPSRKLGRMVDAESSLERDFLFLLEKDPRVIFYEEQPLRVEYSGPDGRKRRYVPDAIAHFGDWTGRPTGLQVVYEVKYRSELAKAWPDCKPKYRAAITVGRENGWRFRIVTEREIRTPLLDNLKFLHFFARTESDFEPEFRERLTETLRKMGPTTPRDLLAAAYSAPEHRTAVTPVLWRLVGERAFATDLRRPLSMTSTIRLPEGPT